MLAENFVVKGYKDVTVNGMCNRTESNIPFVVSEIEVFPTEAQIEDFIAQFDLKRVEIVKSYKVE